MYTSTHLAILKLLDWADATGTEEKKKPARARSIRERFIFIALFGATIFKEDANAQRYKNYYYLCARLEKV